MITAGIICAGIAIACLLGFIVLAIIDTVPSDEERDEHEEGGI